MLTITKDVIEGSPLDPGFDPETWRYRIGAWRFFYQLDDEERIVFMTAAEHRGSAY